jgi:hypothetical protein
MGSVSVSGLKAEGGCGVDCEGEAMLKGCADLLKCMMLPYSSMSISKL